MDLKLITDRTSADVEYAKSYQGKKWEDLSAEQKTEYLLGLRGAYSYIDLNRVENAVKYLSDLLNLYGYPNTVTTKTDWDANDILKVEEIQRYLDNIAELRNKYYSNIEDELPTTSTWLTMEGANEIEKILADIDQILRNMQNVFVHSASNNHCMN